jgi:hypothetical protein
MRSYYANKEAYWELMESKRTQDGLPKGCFDFISIHTSYWDDSNVYTFMSPICLTDTRGRDTIRPDWEDDKYTGKQNAVKAARKLAAWYAKQGKQVHVVFCG